MQRSIGVTLIGVISLIGSLLCLAMGVLVGFVMFLAPSPNFKTFPGPPAFLRVILFLAVLVYVLPAIWGILTSIGLFRLKNWARISIIVFSVLLILMGGFSGLASLAIPLPAPSNTVPPSVITEVRMFMALFSLGLMGIGIWWAVFFNRPKVKAQFVTATATGDFSSQTGPSATAAPVPTIRIPRPVSITVIAWLMLVGCLFLPVGLMLHAPAVFFTKILTGRPSVVFYIVFAALNFYAGIGLLQLKENARRLAIACFFFGLVNSAVFYLAPGGAERMQALTDMESKIFPWMRTFQAMQFQQFDQRPFMAIGAVGGVVGALVPLYFLVTRKQAFDNASATANSGEAS